MFFRTIINQGWASTLFVAPNESLPSVFGSFTKRGMVWKPGDDALDASWYSEGCEARGWIHQPLFEEFIRISPGFFRATTSTRS
jgi:hypothetical protein